MTSGCHRLRIALKELHLVNGDDLGACGDGVDNVVDGADRHCFNGLTVVTGQAAGAVAGVAARRVGHQGLTCQLYVRQTPDELLGFAAKHAPADDFDATATR